MSDATVIQSDEFSRGWNLILASFIGIMTGLMALPFYTYGLFAAPLEIEFGWTRAQSQSAMLAQTIGVLGVLPFLGLVCDKYGVRRVALLSMLLFGIGFAMMSQLRGGLWQYYLTALVFGVVGAGTLPITWTRAIIAAFDKNRGLAIGVALMGTGITGIIAPHITNWAIETHGWRNAYLILASLPLLVGLPVVYLFFKQSNTGVGTQSGPQQTLYGVTLQVALRDYRFWLIAIGFLVISFGIGGSIPNLFPYFTGEGFGPGQAAGFLSVIGVSVMFGRVLTGFLLDRFWGPAVAALLMALPAISCLLLASGSPSVQSAYLATILIGFAAGAEFDIIAYLASRYFGLKHYSKIYSWLYAAFAIGAATAPALFGFGYDKLGNYNAVFSISAVLFMLGSVLLLFLGRYPVFVESEKSSVSSV